MIPRRTDIENPKVFTIATHGEKQPEPHRGKTMQVRRMNKENTQPSEVEVVEGFWFAWAAFHPKTSVYTAGGHSHEGSQ